MFFNHANQNQPETENFEKIVYLLGFNPKSLYFFANFQKSGYFPIILETPQKISKISKEEFTIKEDRLLQHRKIKIRADHQMSYPGLMLIIPEDTPAIKANLTLLSPDKLQNLPVIYLGFFEHLQFLTEIVKTPVIQGYLHHFPEYEKKQLTISGRGTALTLSCEADNPAVAILNDVFETNTNPNAEQNFWSNFIPYAVSSLTAAAKDKNITQIIKSPEDRQLVTDCVNEMLQLAAKENLDIETTDILKKIYNIPNSYSFPLQYNLKKGQFGELNKISSFLLEKATKNTLKIPFLRQLFKQIYNKTLA